MLNPRKLDAIGMLAAHLTVEEVAKRCGVTSRTIESWRANEEFANELAKQRNAWRDRAINDGIADQTRRLFRLNDRWRRMQAVIEQRAAFWGTKEKDPETTLPPGALTGVLGSDGNVDIRLLRELRAHEEQAARELHQWEREAPTGKQIMIVIPQVSAPTTHQALEAPPEDPPLQLPGVVIDLVPQR